MKYLTDLPEKSCVSRGEHEFTLGTTSSTEVVKFTLNRSSNHVEFSASFLLISCFSEVGFSSFFFHDRVVVSPFSDELGVDVVGFTLEILKSGDLVTFGSSRLALQYKRNQKQYFFLGFCVVHTVSYNQLVENSAKHHQSHPPNLVDLQVWPG